MKEWHTYHTDFHAKIIACEKQQISSNHKRRFTHNTGKLKVNISPCGGSIAAPQISFECTHDDQHDRSGRHDRDQRQCENSEEELESSCRGPAAALYYQSGQTVLT